MESTSGAQKVRPIEILLVEDNPADIRLTQEILREARVDNKLHVAIDGDQALQFLNREAPFQDAPRPDLVLLDLNLPRRDGREVLAAVKDSADLRTIPVVVLTTSQAEQDILRSYSLHANCYINKPVNLEQFIRVMNVIEEFWLSIVRLPVAERR
ncbi:MAG: response regulator [Leptospirales bacterium]|nr:response regulator [Leptospirales bacterium]